MGRGGSPAWAQFLLEPQLFLEPQVLHLLAAAPAVLPTAVLHMGAAGSGHTEPGDPAVRLQRRLQLNRAGQLVAATVEGATRVREAQLEQAESGGRGEDHGAGSAGDRGGTRTPGSEGRNRPDVFIAGRPHEPAVWRCRQAASLSALISRHRPLRPRKPIRASTGRVDSACRTGLGGRRGRGEGGAGSSSNMGKFICIIAAHSHSD